MAPPKSPISLHAALAAELPDIVISWTEADALVAGGNIDGSAQGPYVTAYGIPKEALAGCKGWALGSEHKVRLIDSGQHWRATRFGWGLKNPAGDTALYEWIPVGPLPAGVATLAELCKHLIDKDGVRYPEAIYHADHLTKKILGNPANMLFDFWENRQFRYAATLAEDFDWRTYLDQPGRIPVSATLERDGKKLTFPITHVLGVVVSAPKTSAAPGATGQAQNVDELWKKVQPYLATLAAQTRTVDAMLATIDRVNRERVEIVAKVQLLGQIASCSVEANGDPLPWKRIQMWCDQIAPLLHKRLMDMPIDTTGVALDAFDPSKSLFASIATPDARDGVEKAILELRSLLLTDTKFRDAVMNWAKPAVASFLRGDPVAWNQLNELTEVAAAAWFSLSNSGDAAEDTDKAIALVEQAKAGPAQSASDILGESSSAVILALIGKSMKLPKGVTLFAGPTSFRCATATSWATWKYQKLAAQSYGELSGLPPTAQDVALGMAGWKTFGGQLVEHLPPDVQTKVKDVVAAGKLDELAALKQVVADEVKKEFPLPTHYVSSMVVLSFISTAMSLRDFAAKPANRNVLLRAIDWADVSVTVASFTLGTIDYFLKASGKQTAASAEKMGRLLGRANIAGAIMAILKGGVAFVTAAKKRDGYAGVTAWLDTVGGCMSLLAIGAVAFGWTIPGLGQALLIFMLLSGTLSIGDIARKSLPTTNQLVLALIKSVTDQPLTKYATTKDSNIGRLLGEMRDYVDIGVDPNKSAKLAFFANEYFTVSDLRKAGLGDQHIKMLVNHQGNGLANNLFGAGPAAPASPGTGGPLTVP